MIRVLIVDDSVLMRNLLTELIGQQPDIQVVGAAPDPYAARELIKQLSPDVLTLDVEMPRMDGLDFLERLMRLRPMPVVMVSSLTEQGSQTTLRALELGAVDFVTKPRLGAAGAMQSYVAEIADKIRAAAMSRPRRLMPTPVAAAAPPVARPAAPAFRTSSPDRLIAIGASTGGTEAIKDLLVQLPAGVPPIVIAQHMPPGFTASFAKRLDGLCAFEVREAQGGEVLRAGLALIAPGHAHLVVVRRGGQLVAELDHSDPVNRHRPSVDVLFRSVATQVGARASGVILTGMGKDGARGLLEMRQAGAITYAQDEASCVVYGMPKEAVLIGAAPSVGSPGRIAQQLLTDLQSPLSSVDRKDVHHAQP